MITADPLGTFAVIIIVALVILAGTVALLVDRNRERSFDLFSDDFIPDRAVVAATDRALPQFGTNHKETAA